MDKKREGKIIHMDTEPLYNGFLLDYIKEELDFKLSDDQWSVIDREMERFWNTPDSESFKLLDDSNENIYNEFIKQKTFIPLERIDEITNAIWDYVVMMGDLEEFEQ